MPKSQEDISSPISAAQIFDFCDNGFFPEPLRSSEVSSCSGGGGGCCYDDNSYTTDLSFSSFPSDIMPKFNDTTTTTTTTNSSFSGLLDSNADAIEPDISATLTFPPSAFSVPPLINDGLDMALLQTQIPLTDVVVGNGNGFSDYSPDSVTAIAAPELLPGMYKEDCLYPLPSYVCLDQTSPSSCSFLDHPGMGAFFGGNLNLGIVGEASGIFSGCRSHGRFARQFAPDLFSWQYSTVAHKDIQWLLHCGT